MSSNQSCVVSCFVPEARSILAVFALGESSSFSSSSSSSESSACDRFAGGLVTGIVLRGAGLIVYKRAIERTAWLALFPVNCALACKSN